MPVNALELRRNELDRALPRADPALSRLVERHAEALLAARPEPGESTSQRVRRLLHDMLGKEGASLALVSERMHMSERSLQRRLAQEAISFDALLDDVRRTLALRYLTEPKLAVAEVAYLLGYSEPSPFHRAFKRWTGMTPSEARRRAA
jgi:AraC-like DNA-binding protein